MQIRIAKTEDLPAIMALYEQAKRYMKQTGNPTQWAGAYPQPERVRADLEKGQCHVCVENGRIEGVFTLIFGEEPTYRVIEQGAWPDEKPYATLHRMASSGRVPRVSDACFSYAKARVDRLRVDTHRDNGPMRRAIERNGFVYCGVIHVQDGSARLAYQFTGKEEE